MRKLIMTVGLSMLLMTGLYAQSIKLNINGANITRGITPIQESGTTLVPLRVVGDHLGAQVDWDGKTKTVVITKGGTRLKLGVGSERFTINNMVQHVSVAPKIIKGTTMVPIRIISENLDSQVEWDSRRRTVFITSGRPKVTKEMFIKNNKVVIDKNNLKALFDLNFFQAKELFGTYTQEWFGQKFEQSHISMHYYPHEFNDWNSRPASAWLFTGTEFFGLNFTETPAQVRKKFGAPLHEGIDVALVAGDYYMAYQILDQDVHLLFEDRYSPVWGALVKDGR